MSEVLPLADELAAVSARMSGLLLSEQTVASALSLVTALAKDTVPGTVGAGVTLVDEHGKKTTAAATDALVERADSAQYELGEGPCLTAWEERILIRVADLSSESRWPRWVESVRALELRAVISAPLVAGDTALGALKVYAAQAGAYGERAERLVTMFAGQAAVLLANVRTADNARRFSSGLAEAMRSRDQINIAKGIVMAREGVDEETALSILVGEAQRDHKQLREVAGLLVRSTRRLRR